jgi:hypothetical protein
MSKHPRQQPTAGPAGPLDFTPVELRRRADGWTPERQVGFIRALAATGCIEDAARSVGMSARSARDLRTRADADSLRTAWEAALAIGIGRLAEAALSRAIHGTAKPVFYKGEQIGETRRFDERLTQFLLRYHAPERYGAWRDQTVMRRDHPDGADLLYGQAMRRLVSDCIADQTGRPRKVHEPLRLECDPDDPAEQARCEAAEDRARQQRMREEEEEFERELARDARTGAAGQPIAVSSAGPASSAPDGSSAPLHEGNSAFAVTGAEVTEVPQPLDPAPPRDRAAG